MARSFGGGAHAKWANEIPNAQVQAEVAEAMERASRGIHKVGVLAERIGSRSSPRIRR